MAAGGGFSGESGIDLNFDFIDFDCSVFEDEAFAVFDRSNDSAMFYELKSKTVPPLDET